MRAVLLLALLTLAPLTQIAVAQGLAADPLTSWVTVLQRFVNEHGEVDFQGLASDPGELKAFVNYVRTVSPDSAPSLFPTREAKLAYHINAYNALSMYIRDRVRHSQVSVGAHQGPVFRSQEISDRWDVHVPLQV